MQNMKHDALVIPDALSAVAFVELASSGSLTRTAEKLNMTKSTLSRRIRSLENELGHALLRREANRLIITPAGSAFSEFCQQLLNLAGHNHKTLETLQDEVSGVLHIAMHDAFARGWLGELLEHFLHRHPGLRLVLRTCYTPPQCSATEEIVLWLGKTSENGLRHELLGQLTQSVYASPDYLACHPINAPEDLARNEWIDMLGQNESGLDLRHPQHGVITLPVNTPKVRVDQLVLQGDAIVRGNGIGFYPDWLAQLRQQAHPGSLQRCLAGWTGPSLPIWLMYPYGQLTLRSRELIRYLKENCPVTPR